MSGCSIAGSNSLDGLGSCRSEMAFVRKITDRHPRCGTYQCPERATVRCSVCARRRCVGCLPGHVRWHEAQGTRAQGGR